MRFTAESVRLRWSILAMEYITVEWRLPPKWLPISTREASVNCLARYIASCRGKVTARVVDLWLSSSTCMPNLRATCCWIASILLARICAPSSGEKAVTSIVRKGYTRRLFAQSLSLGLLRIRNTST